MTGSSSQHGRTRIALVTTELRMGGAERCLTNLATGLDRDRFEPVVYCLAPNPAESELVDRLVDASVEVHFLGARSSWRFFSTKRKLQHLLDRQAPDIIHTFLFHANVLGALAAKHRTAARIVLGVRVADPAIWRLRLERLVAKRAHRVVCVSRSVAQFVHRRAGIPVEKLVVIPNGIDPDQYPPRNVADLTQFGIVCGRPVILFVGRLELQKGVDWLLRLAPAILARMPEHEFLIVGDGPQRRSLSRLANSLGIAANVHFAGRRKDVPEILCAARLLVLPSRWEGMPNVLLEAMAAGLPIVATSAAGVEELLGPESASQVVAFGDDFSFVDRVAAILQDSSQAFSLGQRNRQRAASCFSLADMIKAHEALYESLVRGDSFSGKNPKI
jgi:glycosyltransferase involved in cell wall biosynthesis